MNRFFAAATVLSLLITLMLLPAGALAKEDSMLLIQGGSFSMGSPESEPWRGADETPHTVTISSFYMSAYEVTQREYEALMGSNPSTFPGADRPVEGISWYDAIEFCNAKSEAEGLTPAYVIEGQKVVWDRSADGYAQLVVLLPDGRQEFSGRI